LAKVAPYAVSVQVKTDIHPKGQPTAEADLERLIGMLRAVHYRGYVILEYEGKAEPRTAIPRYATALRKLLA
jgi:sugar phosphate isomerase/epimerase